jgi:PAS domain S-box-containing protein
MESVARARAVMDIADEAIVTFDEHGVIDSFNRAAEQLYGYDRSEVVGRCYLMLVPEKDRARYAASLQACDAQTLAQYMSRRHRVQGVRKDGRVIDVEVGVTTVRAVGHLVFTAAARLTPPGESSGERTAEELIRAALEASDDAILIIGNAHEPTFGNERFTEMWGIPQLSIETRDTRALLEKMATAVEEGFSLAALENGSDMPPRPGVLRMRDGRELEVSGYCLRAAGIRRSVWTFRDVTEQRQTELSLRQLAAIVESTTDAIISTTPDGVITSWSAGAERMFGYTAAEVIGRSAKLITPPDKLREYEELRRAGGAVKRGDRVLDFETVRLHKDGTRVDVSMSWAPIKDASGAVTGVGGIVRDISTRKRLEEQFLQAQKMESLGTLAGGVAHDFNNLMTAILGISDINLEQLPPESPLHEDFQEIRETSERAANLSLQLLAFSRRQIIEPTVVNLNDVVHRVERMLRRIIGEDITLVTGLNGELWPVKLDEGQFEQVLVNLAVNARDAMPGGGTLTVETDNVRFDRTPIGAPDLAAGEYAMLSMGDTGHGMSAEVRARIFEPFFTTKEAGRGTGLGLATSYGIVTQAGGLMRVYSEPGLGATFKIYLPRVRGRVRRDAGRPRPAPAARGSETILVVEDECAVRTLTARVMRGLGYHIVTTEDGAEALRVMEARGDEFDLVMTDLVMPRMGGRELADRLAAGGWRAKVLFTSGYTDDAILRHGVQEHQLAFLRKPYSPGMLAAKVRAVLDAAICVE